MKITVFDIRRYVESDILIKKIKTAPMRNGLRGHISQKQEWINKRIHQKFLARSSKVSLLRISLSLPSAVRRTSAGLNLQL